MSVGGDNHDIKCNQFIGSNKATVVNKAGTEFNANTFINSLVDNSYSYYDQYIAPDNLDKNVYITDSSVDINVATADQSVKNCFNIKSLTGSPEQYCIPHGKITAKNLAKECKDGIGNESSRSGIGVDDNLRCVKNVVYKCTHDIAPADVNSISWSINGASSQHLWSADSSSSNELRTCFDEQAKVRCTVNYNDGGTQKTYRSSAL